MVKSANLFPFTSLMAKLDLLGQKLNSAVSLLGSIKGSSSIFFLKYYGYCILSIASISTILYTV